MKRNIHVHIGMQELCHHYFKIMMPTKQFLKIYSNL